MAQIKLTTEEIRLINRVIGICERTDDLFTNKASSALVQVLKHADLDVDRELAG